MCLFVLGKSNIDRADSVLAMKLRLATRRVDGRLFADRGEWAWPVFRSVVSCTCIMNLLIVWQCVHFLDCTFVVNFF